MKIDEINISNYLQAKDISIKTLTPVTLIAGHNGSGKSSIRDAIHHALTGEASRVKMKKDYDLLVSNDTETGFAEIVSGDKKFSIVIPSGKGNHSDNHVLPYVLDAQRFAQLGDTERRAYLFGISGVDLNPASVCEKMISKGCNADMVDRIKSMLRAGFPTAQKEAENKAREAKGSWKTVTGGETWGKDKAEKWQPALPDTAIDKASELLNNIHGKIKEIESELSEKRELLGSVRQHGKQLESRNDELESLRKQADSISRIKEKLERDTAELADLECKVAQMKSAQSRSKIPDPLMASFCQSARDLDTIIGSTAGVIHGDGTNQNWCEFIDSIKLLKQCIADYDKAFGISNDDDSNPVSELAKYENSLRIMRNSVTNGHRDLAVAEEAKTKLDSMEDTETKVSGDVEGIEASIKQLTESLNQWKTDERKYQSIVDQHKKRDSAIQEAGKLNQEIKDWIAIADQLSPDGIPAELLGSAIKPINDRLLNSAQWSWMMKPEINSDMSITVTKEGGTTKIPYALLSVSEKWRVDAMIAEAISHVTGIKILLLDGFDVLDMPGRGDLIAWIDQISGDVDTCILFGTLKESPSRLPETFAAYWIENGSITESEVEKVAA